MIMSYVDGLLYFNFIFGSHKKTEYTLFHKNIISMNFETGAEKIFPCYPRSPCSLRKYSIGKVRTSPRLQFLYVIIYTVTSDIITYYGTTISISFNNI